MAARGEASVPDGWQRVRLGDVADFQQGGTPAKANAEYWDGNVPFVTGADLGERRIGQRSARSFLTEGGLNSGSTVICNAGDLLLATRTRVGLVGVATEILGASQDITLITPKDTTDHSYLYGLLDNRAAELQRMARGTTIQGVTREDIDSLSILLPPLPEQQAIAAVLNSIDDAIEGAEAVIAATGQLRDSLLHDLLTRGLPGQHTEFRDVPGLGTIPADWEVVRLGDVVSKFEYGTSVKCSSEPVGMPILRIPNVASGQLNLNDLKYAELGPKESASVQLEAGDILLVRTNGNPDICGQCWVSDGLEGRWGYASYLVRGRADRSVLNPWFVGHFLKAEVGRRLLKGNIRTSAGNYNLSVGGLGSMPLPCPPLNEQDSIVDTILSLSQSTELAGEELAGLRLLKESTADALLTGRVRVVRS